MTKTDTSSEYVDFGCFAAPLSPWTSSPLVSTMAASANQPCNAGVDSSNSHVVTQAVIDLGGWVGNWRKGSWLRPEEPLSNDYRRVGISNRYLGTIIAPINPWACSGDPATLRRGNFVFEGLSPVVVSSVSHCITMNNFTAKSLWHIMLGPFAREQEQPGEHPSSHWEVTATIHLTSPR